MWICCLSITELLRECKFQLNSFFLELYFDSLFEDWSVVYLLYFVLSLLDTFFTLFPETIIRLIFWILSDFFVMVQAKGWNHYEYCLSFVVNFVMDWLGSALCLYLISISNLQFLNSWKFFFKVLNLLLADLHRLNTNIFYCL